MASLRELQRSFAAALRDPAVACPVLPPANLSIYRNNASIVFRTTVEAGFPVIRKRVGDDYFRQLAYQYRERFPSRSGDLHFVGRDFPAFLDEHLRGTDYHWLADLALIERARDEVAISPEWPALGPEVLASFPQDELERVVFVLQPGLRLIASPYPVFSVWLANQDVNASPVDQSLGPEAGMVLRRGESVNVRFLKPQLHSYLSALKSGATLGDAISVAGLDDSALAEALGVLFSERLACSAAVAPAART